MLIIKRRRGESIQIGSDIVVTVLGATGGQVQLGIAVPQHVRIQRQDAAKKGLLKEGGAHNSD